MSSSSSSVAVEVRCPECRGSIYTSNETWAKCDLCGSRVWFDRSHPHAPPDLPRHLVGDPWDE